MKLLLKLILTFVISLATSRYSWGLEIDEKLTTRFLKISSSNRTVLINRGLEDGLVVGDHAKFFLTTGVIARGVVVKASPTRSIWSIYRIVNPEKIYKDLAVNIKITNPVEITDDPTKSLYVKSAQTKVQVLRGDTDVPTQVLTEDEKADLGGVDDFGEVITGSAKLVDKTKDWEAFGLLNFNNATGTVNEGNDQTFESTGSNIDFSLGVEKYFSSTNSFLKQLSVFAMIRSGNSTLTSIEGSQIENSVFEYGGGAHYHFMTTPFALGRLIPFFGGSFGLGTVSSTLTFLGNNVTGTSQSPVEGSSNFFSFGGGIKYFTQRGFGVRALVDFYRRSETYTFAEESSSITSAEVTRTTSGPRFMLGLAYRW